MVAGRVKQAIYVMALFFGALLWLSLLMLFSQVAQDTEEFHPGCRPGSSR